MWNHAEVHGYFRVHESAQWLFGQTWNVQLGGYRQILTGPPNGIYRVGLAELKPWGTDKPIEDASKTRQVHALQSLKTESTTHTWGTMPLIVVLSQKAVQTYIIRIAWMPPSGRGHGSQTRSYHTL